MVPKQVPPLRIRFDNGEFYIPLNSSTETLPLDAIFSQI